MTNQVKQTEETHFVFCGGGHLEYWLQKLICYKGTTLNLKQLNIVGYKT